MREFCNVNVVPSFLILASCLVVGLPASRKFIASAGLPPLSRLAAPRLTPTAVVAAASRSKWRCAEEVFQGKRNIRGTNALHNALTQSDSATASRLIDTGDEFLLNQQTERGITPLMMLAMGYCEEELIWKLLERRGSASIAAFSEKRFTASDYARRSVKRGPEVLDALVKLEAEEKKRTAKYRCPFCGDVVLQRPEFASYAERAIKGSEDNPLLKAFFERQHHIPLLQRRFHSINHAHKKSLKKELTESLAILDILEDTLPSFHDGWHIVDLCCGKALTCILASHKYPGIVATAVDRLEPRLMPHYLPEDGITYTQLDILHDTFMMRMEELVSATSRPTLLIGMHLCGRLSLQAIQAFQRVAGVRALLLSPCCLPRKDDTTIPSWLFACNAQDEQYNRWACHLQEEMIRDAPDSIVNLHTVSEMIGPKNKILSAVKM